ncbi:hypothetical protein RFI_07548 [Reticulomyxa filosa]|uniref:Uncharacterized protein n=1 Tax=Reticulomyxa filosa TaxID=46433 RepID=X6NWB7_RETFI|nr:hypothetical protein RFI_07548 [Reticulomyxa filosa]|eukprot:ETO29567.1 hypothetical protein RFI_07548 [Reticulomyxa filosa]
MRFQRNASWIGSQQNILTLGFGTAKLTQGNVFPLEANHQIANEHRNDCANFVVGSKEFGFLHHIIGDELFLYLISNATILLLYVYVVHIPNSRIHDQKVTPAKDPEQTGKVPGTNRKTRERKWYFVKVHPLGWKGWYRTDKKTRAIKSKVRITLSHRKELLYPRKRRFNHCVRRCCQHILQRYRQYWTRCGKQWTRQVESQCTVQIQQKVAQSLSKKRKKKKKKKKNFNNNNNNNNNNTRRKHNGNHKENIAKVIVKKNSKKKQKEAIQCTC